MGQKTNPKAFRLVTTEKHLSSWHSSKEFYSGFLKDDYLIRKNVEKIFEDFFVLSKVEILRGKTSDLKSSAGKIKISLLFPRAKEVYRKAIKYFENIKSVDLKKTMTFLVEKKYRLTPFIVLLLHNLANDLILSLQKKISYNYKISFNFIKNRFEDPTLIAKFISNQLENRITFRRIVKQCLKKTAIAPIKGIKIELSGRLNGADIARSEWKREGKVPLHTLGTKINYVSHEAHTIYGIIGIKVWLSIK